jgi:hypothetical protein
MPRVGDLDDQDQCLSSIGVIPCNTIYKCYLCGAPVIPLYDNRRISPQYLKKDHGENPYCNTIPSKWNYTSVHKSIYPNCEHIIPCNTRETDEIKRKFLNITSLYIVCLRKIKKKGLVARLNPEIGSSSILKTGKKLDIILKILLTMNYAWAHAFCNSGCKSNVTLIDYNKTKKNMR